MWWGGKRRGALGGLPFPRGRVHILLLQLCCVANLCRLCCANNASCKWASRGGSSGGGGRALMGRPRVPKFQGLISLLRLGGCLWPHCVVLCAPAFIVALWVGKQRRRLPPFVVPLTFIEFPACEQIFLITPHGATSALQGNAWLWRRGEPCSSAWRGLRNLRWDEDWTWGDVNLEIARWPPHSSLPLPSLRCCTRWRRHTSALPWLPGN